MSTEETYFRAALLLMGFTIVMLGAAMAWKTEKEVMPFVLSAFGAACMVVATNRTE